jgi:hypothetical protein
LSQTSPKRIEKIAVIISIGALLWASRIGIISILGDHWFGTFGVTISILGVITWLSWTDKLGKFGRIYKHILTHKITKKLTKIRLGFAVFTLLIFGLFSAGIHASNTIYEEKTMQATAQARQENPKAFDQEKLTAQAYDKIATNPIQSVAEIGAGLVLLPVFAITHFEQYSILMGTMNNVFDGQLVHIVDILLIEEIELLGLLAFVSYLQRKPKTVNIS